MYKRDGKVFAKYLQDNYPHLYDQGVWIFGDWDNALLAAGFDPRKMRMRRLWDQEKVINGIRGMREKNLPLYARYVIKNHGTLFSSAQRQFGPWSKALRAAGVTKRQVPKKVYRSRLTTLRALRDAMERCSKEDIPQTLRLEATHYFGSLRNAFFALKKDQKLLHGWSKKKITGRKYEELPMGNVEGINDRFIFVGEQGENVHVRLPRRVGS